MKNYIKPIIEELIVNTDDMLFISGIVLNNQNAGFDNPDELL